MSSIPTKWMEVLQVNTNVNKNKIYKVVQIYTIFSINTLCKFALYIRDMQCNPKKAGWVGQNPPPRRFAR